MASTLVVDGVYYDILSFLGKGSFGSVVLAKDEHDQRVAIKRIWDESWINNNEISALFRLNHPGIIKIRRYHCSDEAHYIVMDYIPGKDLWSYIQPAPCIEPTAKMMFRQLVLSLKAAHKRRIYHGDLRLENILLNADGTQVILADWGMASFSQYRRVKSLPYGAECIEYKPPEVFTRVSPASDVPTPTARIICNAMLDVWMLGIVLYTMMTRRFPFSGPTVVEDILECRYIMPESFSDGLRDLVDRIFRPLDERITLLGILYHPWLRCESASLDALLDP